MQRNFVWLSCASTLVLAQPCTAYAQNEDSAQITGLQDIVVTAQRREQNLQDVPISITALDAGAIEANRIQNIGDLGSLAPNTSVRKQAGGGNLPMFTIRGVSASNSAAETDNPVSVYIDGVYLGRAVGAIFDLADIERIEILKGPQGTLFGRNSTGGAVSVTTADPSGVLGGKADFTIGNYGQRRARASLDLPEWNGFSLRLSVLHSERDGDIRNLGAGTRWDFTSRTNGKWGIRTSPKTLGAENTDAFRVALRYEAGDFDATYKFDFTDSISTGNGTTPIIGDPLGIIASQPQSGINITSKRPKAVNNAFTTPTEQRTTGHLFTINFKASDVVSLKNIMSYRTNKLETSNQIDGAGGLIKNDLAAFYGSLGTAGVPGLEAFAGFNQGSIGDPILLLGIVNGTKNRQFTEEAQIAVDTDAFSLISGVYYFNEDIDVATLGPTAAFAQVAPNFVVPGPFVKPGIVKNKSYAIYGQATAHISETLDINVGGRQTWDDRFAYNLLPEPFETKQDKFTYLVGLDYKPNDDVLAYIKYSTGYVSGGVMNGVEYAPETAKSVEGGVKADLLDRRLRLNAAVYHTRFGGVQFISFDNGVQIQKNAGKAKSTGGELEITAQPLPGLTLNAAAGYSDFKYTEIDPAIGSIDTFQPTFRPSWTGNAAATYELVEFSNGAVLSLRADAQYTSKYDMVAHRTALSVAPSRWILGARASIDDIDLGGTRAKLSVWGRNLTNNRSPTFSATLGLLDAALFEAARTYGVDLGFSF